MTTGKELEETNLTYKLTTSVITVQDEHGVTSYSLRELMYMFHKCMKLREELGLGEFDG
jgi:hypothetical protein